MAGGGAGAGVLLILAALLIVCLVHRRNRNRMSHKPEQATVSMSKNPLYIGPDSDTGAPAPRVQRYDSVLTQPPEHAVYNTDFLKPTRVYAQVDDGNADPDYTQLGSVHKIGRKE